MNDVEEDSGPRNKAILRDVVDATVLGYASLLVCRETPDTFHRLGDRDDDVRSVAASCLLPVAGHLVAQLPEELSRVLAVLWSCLRDMRDDLSSSVGAVMELLGKRKLDVVLAPLTKHTLTGKLVKYDEVIAILGNQAESYVPTSCDPDFPLILLQRTFIRPDRKSVV